MIMYGPVGEAARGGHGSPTFDLVIGFAFLAMTWIQYFRTDPSKRTHIWVSVGISAICGVFIWSGIAALAR